MSRGLRIDDLYDMPVPGQPALSPDGSRVAFARTVARRDMDADERSVWCLAADDSADPQRLTAGPADTSPVWSPSGSRLAFLRPVDGYPQIFVLPAAGGDCRQVTQLSLGAGDPQWAPDGRHIAFDALVDPQSAPTDNGRAQPATVTDTLGYRIDGMGLVGRARRQVHLLDVGSGRTEQLSAHPGGTGSPRWSPDGSTLAYAAQDGPDADVTGQSRAYLPAAHDGSRAPQALTPSFASLPFIDWLPNGAGLLTAGSLISGVGHTRLYRVPVDGGPVIELAADLDRNVMIGGTGYPGGPARTGRGHDRRLQRA